MPDYAELEAASRQIEAILRRGVQQISRLVEALKALPPDTRRAIEQFAWQDDLDRWETEGGMILDA